MVYTGPVLVKRKISIDENIPNSFLENVRPIFQVLSLFGRFPYHISANEIQPFSMTSPIAVYTALLFIISLYLASIVLEVLTEKLANSESYRESLRALMAITYLVHYPLIPFSDWLMAPTMIKYINLWHTYEHHFTKEFSNFPNKHLIRRLSIVTWPIAIYLAYFAAYELCGNSFLLSLIYFPLIYGLYQQGLLWMLCHFHLERQMRKLIEILQKEGLQNRVGRTRRCWLLLSELTSSTGYSLGFVMASIAVTSFIGYIIYCYIFFTSLLDPKASVEWQMGGMVILHSVLYFALQDCCDRTTKELVLLLTTFKMHPPIIKAAGLLVVDRIFFLGFIRNAFTYLIVLVQFKT